MKLLAFVDRVGGVLVAPRRTMARVAAGEGGLSDVLWLLVFRVLAGDTERLAGAIALAPALGALGTVHALLGAASSILPDVLGIVAGAAVLVVAGTPRTRGREIDLAAYCWIPYLAVRVGAALLFTVLQRPPQPHEARALDVLAIGVAAIALASALLVGRAAAPGETDASSATRGKETP